MIKDRLFNWSKWAKSHIVIPISCKSLEALYRPPPCWHAPEPRTNIDLLDAFVIEKHLIQLPRREMNIIVYNYITSWKNFDHFCSKHKIRGSKLATKSQQFEIDLQRAENMLNNLLDMSLSREYKFTNNLNPEPRAAVLPLSDRIAFP